MVTAAKRDHLTGREVSDVYVERDTSGVHTSLHQLMHVRERMVEIETVNSTEIVEVRLVRIALGLPLRREFLFYAFCMFVCLLNIFLYVTSHVQFCVRGNSRDGG